MSRVSPVLMFRAEPYCSLHGLRPSPDAALQRVCKISDPKSFSPLLERETFVVQLHIKLASEHRVRVHHDALGEEPTRTHE